MPRLWLRRLFWGHVLYIDGIFPIGLGRPPQAARNGTEKGLRRTVARAASLAVGDGGDVGGVS